MQYEIDFLPVGEGSKSGDAITFRFGERLEPGQQVVGIVDGGFAATGPSVVEHVRKYYGTDRVDLVISTHPDADHIGGLKNVLEATSVYELWIHRPSIRRKSIESALRHVAPREYVDAMRSALDSAQDLENMAMAKGITIREPFTGLTHGSGAIAIVGPSEDYYHSLFEEGPEEDRGNAISRAVAAAMEFVTRAAESIGVETLTDEGITTPTNNSSAITLLTFGSRHFLLTADAGIPALDAAADTLDSLASYSRDGLRLIQVPHHGSRRNVGPTVLDRLVGPRVGADEKLKTAYISAAPEGSPKHPAKKVQNAFRRRGAWTYVTRGSSKCHHSEHVPERPGWVSVDADPLFTEVDD